MKHKVSELEGALLDAFVEKAEGIFSERTTPQNVLAYSNEWELGGPIIEREHIRLDWNSRFGWFAYPGIDMPIDCLPTMDPAASPLIAAMRAYVASKFGEEVEL